MKQNGFTLIEIVAVIAIIAILGIVTIPIITGVLSNNDEKLDKNQKKLIIGAARNYAVKNAFTIGNSECVEVSELKKEGFLDTAIDSSNYKDYFVKISKQGNNYKYEIVENCP